MLASCKKCGGEMQLGIAIDSPNYNEFSIMPQAKLTIHTMHIVECNKCTKCGWSEDIEENVKPV